VTPFVDVVLVLLVIFMVTAPMLMKDVIGIHLPKSTSSDQKALQSLGVAVTKQGQILLNGE
jgi:biopolymer transport protein ExbD